MPSQLLRFWPVWSVYWRNRWDFARFSLVFRLLEALLFAPLAAVAGHALVGQPVIDSTDLVRYALSVRGFAATFLGATVFLTLRMVEEAGLSAIAWGALQEQPLRAGRAVRIVAGILPRLLRLGGMILAAGVLLVTPLAAVTAWCAGRLLKQHDINYYLAFRPPEFLGAIATVVAVALPTAAIALWLAVRWRLAVQVVLGERQSTWGVLRSSTRLVRGAWKRIAAAWLGTALLVIGLGLLASLLSRACGWGAAWLASDRFREQILIFVILQVLRVVLTSYVTLPGSCLTASVFTALYLEQRGATVGALGGPVQQALPGEDSSPVPGPVRRLAAGLPLVMIGASVVGNILSLEQLYTQHPVAVTAHRGGTVKSIENTLGAVREAINDGAQFAEIDVQMSRDAVLVVTHDSDLSRLAGV
ncbi:MAG: glycerophosphodiester phosphodiesterase family protein, partial [Planctomycetales bacterium]